MVEPDPWNVIDKNQENTQNCVANQSPNHESNANPSAFEDNFLTIDGSVSEKLPDSCEYIQALGKYILFLQKIYRNFFFFAFSHFLLTLILEIYITEPFV